MAFNRAMSEAETTGEFEAVTEAELVTEEPLGVTRKDSGVRPSTAATLHRIEVALAASARIDTALEDLLRTAKFLAASLAAAQDANRGLERELEALATLADVDGGQRATLERRIQRLEAVLEEVESARNRERSFLVREHDSFIAELVTDHEREIVALRRSLQEMTPAPPSASEGAYDPRYRRE